MCWIVVVVVLIIIVGNIITAFSRGGDNSLVNEIKAGNRIVKFGNYFINDNKTKEPIEWRVLEVSNDKALLITKDAIDCKPYNNEWRYIECRDITWGEYSLRQWRDTTWGECSLRQWLNNEFINQAFSKEEQNKIILTNISNPKNPAFGTRGGNNTQDKIFLLSIDEAEKYFKYEDRVCKVTSYAKQQGAWIYEMKNDEEEYAGEKDYVGNCYWWLRSPGNCQISAAYVGDDGGVLDDGDSVKNHLNAVRPAFFINL